MTLKPYVKVESWTEENKLQIVKNELYYCNDFKKNKDFLRSKRVNLIYLNSIDSESKELL